MTQKTQSSFRVPADAKDGQALNAALSVVNGARVTALLEKAIERLQLLSLLNYEGFANSGDQYVELKGVHDSTAAGVGSILDEQKRLEQRYEELLVATSKHKPTSMDPVLDPLCYANVDNVVERQQREELLAISARLKEFSKQLTRQLKENPNDSDNWKKVVNERNELTNMLSACVRELGSSSTSGAGQAGGGSVQLMSAGGSQLLHLDAMSQKSGAESMRSLRSPSQFGGGMVIRGMEVSYEIFAKKVLDEQSEKVWADEIVKREKETNMNVKHLQNEVTQERTMKEKEIEERQQKLSELKTKVRRLKHETKALSEKRHAEEEAHAEARKRDASDTARLLTERLEFLEKKLELESEVFASIEKHLNKKSAQLTTITTEWTFRQVEENKELDEQLTQDNRKHEELKEKLKVASDRHLLESACRDERDRNTRRTEQDKKRVEDQQKSEYVAATKLQAAFKAFLVRKAVGEAKRKKKKKGGGGGKAKKKS
eukprot:RCo036530